MKSAARNRVKRRSLCETRHLNITEPVICEMRLEGFNSAATQGEAIGLFCGAEIVCVDRAIIVEHLCVS